MHLLEPRIGLGLHRHSDNILKWDMDETAKGGPFGEILDVDIFVNCINLWSPTPPFLTREQLSQSGTSRRLSCVVDVSCDFTNPHNPIPIYDIITTFDSPTAPIDLGPDAREAPPLSIVSIDHLPSLLPREASERFSADLLQSLLDLPRRHSAGVWIGAETLFQDKLAEAKAAERL